MTFFENRAFYEIMWEKILWGGAGHRWQFGAIAFACWMLNTKNTHSECVMLIAFPLQHRLHINCLSF
jgi:hypothetical protein